uniref:MARVEL domain-containing protein n=1 Tax=Rhabditophanes sp. KR3021 TaxID=114890 RepID=A0AC35U669_9BILA
MDYQIVLLGELIYLIAGETGLSMLHGWSEGVFYSFYRDYTPMWLCACLMVLLLLVIISLLLLFLTLHFNIVALINFHVFCLCASWCIAISLTAVGLAYGTPILVALCFLLYFSVFLGFAYIYASSEWKTTDLPLPSQSNRA